MSARRAFECPDASQEGSGFAPEWRPSEMGNCPMRYCKANTSLKNSRSEIDPQRPGGKSNGQRLVGAQLRIILRQGRKSGSSGDVDTAASQRSCTLGVFPAAGCQTANTSHSWLIWPLPFDQRRYLISVVPKAHQYQRARSTLLRKSQGG